MKLISYFTRSLFPPYTIQGCMGGEVGEEYQVLQRGRKYGCGEEYYGCWKKYQVGEGDGNFGEDNQDLKIWGWGRISSFTELYTPVSDNMIFGHNSVH